MRYWNHSLKLLLISAFIALQAKGSIVNHLEDTIDRAVRAGKWTIMVYMANDNDLDPFSSRDIEEMKKIGSNSNVTILVQIDHPGATGRTRRLLIAKGTAQEIFATTNKLDFGSIATLVDFFQWGKTNYPSDYYALILWNHGSGVIDPYTSRVASAHDLYHLDPDTNQLVLDRSVGFLDLMSQRGICFGDTLHSYLTNQKMVEALRQISVILGRKLDILAFDACLMGMIEIASEIDEYVNYMVGSQETEPGDGWPYHLFLAPFQRGSITPSDLAKTAVIAYDTFYKSITGDYTQSAYDLSLVSQLEIVTDTISRLLLNALNVQLNKTVQNAIFASANKRICTCFAEPSYIDYGNFLTNLLNYLPKIQLKAGQATILTQLKSNIQTALALIPRMVIANVKGRNLKNATGVSIYFPSYYIDSSYKNTMFYQSNAWGQLLTRLIG